MVVVVVVVVVVAVVVSRFSCHQQMRVAPIVL